MNVELLPFQHLIYWVSFMGILVIFAFYAPLHAFLRNNKVYNTLLVTWILLLLVSAGFVQPGLSDHFIRIAFSPLLVISYLLCYKVANAIVVQKYNRPMYFSCRVSNFLGHIEAKASTLLETFLQFSMLIVSVLVWYKLSELLALLLF